MVHRYSKQRIGHSDDRVEAGAENPSMQSYGLLGVSLDFPDGPKLITFNNVSCIPTISRMWQLLIYLQPRVVHCHSSVPHMLTQGSAIFNLYRLGEHYTFMDTYSHVAAVPISTSTLSSMTSAHSMAYETNHYARMSTVNTLTIGSTSLVFFCGMKKKCHAK